MTSAKNSMTTSIPHRIVYIRFPLLTISSFLQTFQITLFFLTYNLNVPTCVFHLPICTYDLSYRKFLHTDPVSQVNVLHLNHNFQILRSNSGVCKPVPPPIVAFPINYIYDLGFQTTLSCHTLILELTPLQL